MRLNKQTDATENPLETLSLNTPVSYTHLDVYKRQAILIGVSKIGGGSAILKYHRPHSMSFSPLLSKRKKYIFKLKPIKVTTETVTRLLTLYLLYYYFNISMHLFKGRQNKTTKMN